MLKTFAITGYGRSGTMFIATQLAKSKSWTIEHEPSRHLINVNQRFSRNYYGEVNSYLLYNLPILPVQYRAVIIRDPYAILQSCYNRGHPLTIQVEIQAALAVLLTHISRRYPYFKFDRLVQSKGEVIRLARAVGIEDLEETAITLDCINASEKKESIDFKNEVYEHVREDFNYFMQKMGVLRECNS